MVLVRVFQCGISCPPLRGTIEEAVELPVPPVGLLDAVGAGGRLERGPQLLVLVHEQVHAVAHVDPEY